jgi:hypothetical protein
MTLAVHSFGKERNTLWKAEEMDFLVYIGGLGVDAQAEKLYDENENELCLDLKFFRPVSGSLSRRVEV